MSLKNLPLHWKIILGMFLGVLFGFLMSNFDQTGKDIISDWIKPFGTIFINALKFHAPPESAFVVRLPGPPAGCSPNLTFSIVSPPACQK